MSVKFSCPQCSDALIMLDSHAGEQMSCPTCRGKIRVPGAATKAAVSGNPPSKPGLLNRAKWCFRGVVLFMALVIIIWGGKAQEKPREIGVGPQNSFAQEP